MEVFWTIVAFLVTAFFAIAYGTERWLRYDSNIIRKQKKTCPVCRGEFDAALLMPSLEKLCFDHLADAARIRVQEYDLFERWDNSIPKKQAPPPPPDDWKGF